MTCEEPGLIEMLEKNNKKTIIFLFYFCLWVKIVRVGDEISKDSLAPLGIKLSRGQGKLEQGHTKCLCLQAAKT